MGTTPLERRLVLVSSRHSELAKLARLINECYRTLLHRSAATSLVILTTTSSWDQVSLPHCQEAFLSERDLIVLVSRSFVASEFLRNNFVITIASFQFFCLILASSSLLTTSAPTFSSEQLWSENLTISLKDASIQCKTFHFVCFPNFSRIFFLDKKLWQ